MGFVLNDARVTLWKTRFALEPHMKKEKENADDRR